METTPRSMPSMFVEGVGEVSYQAGYQMGVRWPLWASELGRHPAMTDGMRLAAFNLAVYANNETGLCWPTYRRLGLCSDNSTRAVSTQMRRLKSIGAVRQLIPAAGHNAAKLILRWEILAARWDLPSSELASARADFGSETNGASSRETNGTSPITSTSTGIEHRQEGEGEGERALPRARAEEAGIPRPEDSAAEERLHAAASQRLLDPKCEFGEVRKICDALRDYEAKLRAFAPAKERVVDGAERAAVEEEVRAFYRKLDLGDSRAA